MYIRAYSTRRAAVGELVDLVSDAESAQGQVRLVTALYDWDSLPEAAGAAPVEGEMLLVEAFRLEPVRP